MYLLVQMQTTWMDFWWVSVAPADNYKTWLESLVSDISQLLGSSSLAIQVAVLLLRICEEVQEHEKKCSPYLQDAFSAA